MRLAGSVDRVVGVHLITHYWGDAATRRAVARAGSPGSTAGLVGVRRDRRVNNRFLCGVHSGFVVQGRDISLGSQVARPTDRSAAAGDVDNKIHGDVVNGPTYPEMITGKPFLICRNEGAQAPDQSLSVIGGLARRDRVNDRRAAGWTPNDQPGSQARDWSGHVHAYLPGHIRRYADTGPRTPRRTAALHQPTATGGVMPSTSATWWKRDTSEMQITVRAPGKRTAHQRHRPTRTRQLPT